MKKIIFLTLFCFITIVSCFAQFGGGNGDGFWPYLITTPEHLNNIRLQDEEGNYLYLNCYFEQYGDIDLGVAPWNEGEGWEPIGTAEHPFTGNYAAYWGNIQNLTINRPSEDNVGLFGYVQEACLFNINLENANVIGRNNVGGIVGTLLASSVNLKGMGPSWPPNYKCTVTGTILGNQYVGGIAGYAKYSQATRCYSFCDVSGTDCIGGLFGLNEIGIYTEPEYFWEDTWIYTSGSIYKCYSSGEISASGDIVGGFVGKNSQGSISRCYSSGNVTTEGIYIGGFVGLNTDGGEIENCYSYDSTVIGSDDTAGLVGFNLASSISNSYTKTTVLGSGENIQGLVGSDTGTITNSYWDMDISGIAEPGNGEGRSTLEMTFPYSVDTFVDWNFENIWEEDEDQGDGSYKDGYPYLKWEHRVILHDFAGGSGTEEDPYQIATAFQLNNVRKELDKHFLQIRDIYLDQYPYNEGSGWLPIGSEFDAFTGSFNGDGFSISNLFINRPGYGNNYAGLFGYTEGVVGFTLQNIHLLNVNIIGNDYVGGLVGHNKNTTITDCSVTGTIEGLSYVGGLIGENVTATINTCSAGIVNNGSGMYIGGLVGFNDNSTIQFCHSSGAINSGSTSVGGLVGINFNAGTIEESYSSVDVTASSQSTGGLVGNNYTDSGVSNCYALGSVTTGSTYTGGFAGQNKGTITNCFSIGDVIASNNAGGFLGQGSGTDSGCYWNTETSDDFSGGTAIGRTTAEMTSPYDEDTYVDWNFDTIWQEDADYSINNGYPYLQNITYVEAEISEPTVSDILINEICGVDVYPENDFNGYIELINVQPYAISLENVEIWYFDNGSATPTDTLQLYGVVLANEFIVIAQDYTMFFETHGDPPPDFIVERDEFGNSKFPLDGEDDIIQVVLSDSRAVTIDRFNDSTTPWTWNSDQSYRRVSTGDGGIFANWEPGDGIPGGNVYTELSIPENAQILFSEGNVNLTWQSVMGATSYKIYSANNPQNSFPIDWTLEDSGIESTTWTDISPEESRKFYRIVAVKQRGK